MTIEIAQGERSRLRKKPAFFHEVADRSHHRWNQLESDPELAGPWKQLFSQVQSPRHVLSELLQNADDAGATSAAARIDGDMFLFEHDGDDFDAAQFASLCRFGFSNKRNLHTIGFRGIGFKSTFSLGDAVQVITPTLAIEFRRTRFTEPIWLDDVALSDTTQVRVRIQDVHRKRELEKNLNEWAANPISLLFFASVRQLSINNHAIKAHPLSDGPVSGSEWIRLDGCAAERVLVVRSGPESFPDDAVTELRQERNLDDVTLPPCRVDVVFGIPREQRLYVILPTGVKPPLTFSCNAPFVQDPARTAIKDPGVSPTNRWLLARLGKLAGRCLADWLDNSSLTLAERSHAYHFLPDPEIDGDSLEEDCATEIAKSLTTELSAVPVLLTHVGDLALPMTCVAPPLDLYAVWDEDQLLHVFGKPGQHLLAREVDEQARHALVRWEWLRVIGFQELFQRLSAPEPVPKPESLDRLLTLWHYLHAKRFGTLGAVDQLRIVPVVEGEDLKPASTVIRPPSRKQLSTDDWTFLLQQLHVLDSHWLAVLDSAQENTKESTASQKQPVDARMSSARELLKVYKFDEPTPIDRIVAKAYESLVALGAVEIATLVRLTHILAALNAKVPNGFMYVNRNAVLRLCDTWLIQDADGRIEGLVPALWALQHCLHDSYLSDLSSCTPQQWAEWAASDKSGLRRSVPIEKKTEAFWGKNNLLKKLRDRNAFAPAAYQLKREQFSIDDYDFPQELWQHWELSARQDETVWSRVFALICEDRSNPWVSVLTASVKQESTQYRYSLECGPIAARWITRLQSLPCLLDTFDRSCHPAQLLMRTPSTETLMGIERFVKAEHDVEATKPLLKVLGVRDTPTSPDKLIERIKGLAAAPTPLVHELGRWYDALDRVLARCRPEHLQQARTVFSEQRLILTESTDWASIPEVYQTVSEEGWEGFPVIHSSVRSLSMWTRLGVPERPSLERIIGWLRTLPSREKLDGVRLKRVQSALVRHPFGVWAECRHWLSLDGVWTPIEQLSFRVTMQFLAKSGSLFPGVRARTADFKMLPADTCDMAPFNGLPNLAAAIDYRVSERQGELPVQVKPWLSAIAAGLQRVRLENDEVTAHVRVVARRLEDTAWRPLRLIRVTPYLDGVPAGEAISPDALWADRSLYVRALPIPKIIDSLVTEISRPFQLPQITDAIRYCIERDAAFVDDYLASRFTLDAEAPEQPVTKPPLFPPLSQEPVTQQDEHIIPVTAEADAGSASATPPLEPTENEQGAEETQPVATEPPKTAPPSPPRLSLIERYAALRGFRKSANPKRYNHQDGGFLQKAEGVFDWELFTVTGAVAARLWLLQQSLHKGVQIDADLWEVIKADPATVRVIMETDEGQVGELSGTALLKMVESLQVQVYPATYRLRMTDEQ